MDFAAITAKKESSYTFKGPFYYASNKFEQVDKLDKSVNLDKTYKYAGLDDGSAFIWIPNTDSIPAATITNGDNSIPVIRLTLANGAASGKMFSAPRKRTY